MKKILSLCVALLAATQMFASFVPKFGENGKCTISLSDLKATDGVTIDAKAGTITSDGKGEFYVDLPAEGVDLSACTNLTVEQEGDNIVQFLLVEDAKSGKLVDDGFYSSKFNLDLTKYADKTSAVNKMEWHCNAAGTMTVKSITLTKKVESHFQYKADEVALTDVLFHAWSAPTNGEDQGTVPCTLALNQELSAGGLVYGTSTVNYLQYAPLDAFKEIRIYGTPGLKYRVLLNRETDGGKLVELNPEGDENGLAVCDISSLPYVHLNAIKLAWGISGLVKGLCVSTTATGIRECHVANEQDIIASYNLAGQKVSRNAKGLILQKTKDGKVIKRIVR